MYFQQIVDCEVVETLKPYHRIEIVAPDPRGEMPPSRAPTMVNVDRRMDKILEIIHEM
jgi:hypothetical protein